MTASAARVTFDSILGHSNEVLYQEVGAEAVLLDLASEQYFGLDAVGSRIWELLDGKTALASVHRTLCAEFDAAPDLIGNDLLALTRRLAEAGLVEVR